MDNSNVYIARKFGHINRWRKNIAKAVILHAQASAREGQIRIKLYSYPNINSAEKILELENELKGIVKFKSDLSDNIDRWRTNIVSVNQQLFMLAKKKVG